MVRSIPLFVVAGLLACSGCKTVARKPDAPVDVIKPGLLIGPEATGQAPPPVELPTKEAARLCLRTAQEFERNGQTEDAIRLYEKARTDEPSTAKVASRRLAVLYDKVGDFSKSTTEYEQLIKAHPKDADLLNDLGYSYYCRRDCASAELYYVKAVEADPNHKKAWTNLGLARAMQGKWDDSFKAFCKAVRPADAHCNIAFVMAAQGRTEEAKAQYRQALMLDPNLRLAQAAVARLENPQAPSSASGLNRIPSKYDAAEAAERIPSFTDLEARLVKDGTIKAPTVIPTISAEASGLK